MRDEQCEYGEQAGLSGGVVAEASNLRQVVVTGLHNSADLDVAVQAAVHCDSKVAHSAAR